MSNETIGTASLTRLFHINPGIPCEQALEHASLMLGCINKLTALGATEEDPTLVWAAHLLGEMAKAIVDDVSLGLPLKPAQSAA
ncbi:DUF3077 domain-containing protein [Pseudomonas wadenswilerensis]|uniref:DUF3077 domain-containing protein n=1 Tax=Pseudomonas wadenswilerensis TaxID=1785161 RepID=A0A380T6L2_9PSED|nr:DUF3077 domain-containing protein [Pseudomonas wadenswilerensis]UVM22803.1 DUF3077 domain-containing protein [Pseudomonas wadenswilerensis]SUQ65188.1 hypothetical protein CCOS864_04659 [Pseudomonas wadenswilerensis]